MSIYIQTCSHHHDHIETVVTLFSLEIPFITDGFLHGIAIATRQCEVTKN